MVLVSILAIINLNLHFLRHQSYVFFIIKACFQQEWIKVRDMFQASWSKQYREGPSQHVHLFYAHYYWSEPQSYKSIISTNFPIVFSFKKSLTQFSFQIVSWDKYTFKIYYICCVNWLNVLQQLILWFLPKMQITIFTSQKILWILKESLCKP